MFSYGFLETTIFKGVQPALIALLVAPQPSRQASRQSGAAKADQLADRRRKERRNAVGDVVRRELRCVQVPFILRSGAAPGTHETEGRA